MKRRFPRPARTAMLALSFALLAATSVPSPPRTTGVHTFRDWAVGCDNGRSCHALGLMPPGHLDRNATLSIERGPARDALPTIRIRIEDLIVQGRTPNAFVVDGRTKIATPINSSEEEGVIEIAPSMARPLIAALAKGHNLELVDVAGKSLEVISLSGLNAALQYMDQAQQRIGTVTALVHPGNRPPSAVPMAPALPMISIPAQATSGNFTLSPEQQRGLFNGLRCAGKPISGGELGEHSLDDRHSMILLRWHCGKGEPNLVGRAIIIDAAGAAVPARFDVGMPSRENGTPILRNPDWDPEKQRLTTDTVVPNLPGCTLTQIFVWDGTWFRLVEQSENREIRGNYGYITTWRANAVRQTK
jgi:Protein of unknown function (DUF1176)